MFLVAVFVTAGAGTDRDSYLQRNAYENGGGWGGDHIMECYTAVKMS